MSVTVRAEAAEEDEDPSRVPLAEASPAPEPNFAEGFDFNLFADAYANLNYNFPKPQDAAGTLRAFDRHQGFSLAWVGADVTYAPKPVGGTVSLRLGPSAELHADSCLSQTTRCDADVLGLGFVKQAFASWKPGPGIQVDFGKFDTPLGAEVSESQNNPNYTRGALFWFAQPLFHTGLRGSFQLVETFGVTALVVNGWNQTLDNNAGKTFGLQARWTPVPELGLSLGWLGGPEQDDSATVECEAERAYDPRSGNCSAAPGAPARSYTVDRGGANEWDAWRHVADAVISYRPGERWAFVANADYGVQGTRSIGTELATRLDNQRYYGAALGGRYVVCTGFAVAARGEYLNDEEGLASGNTGLELTTGTLTLESAPSPNLIIRLEGRGDFALEKDRDAEVFKRGEREIADTQWTSILGVVVRTN
jgi:hypothetical protein